MDKIFFHIDVNSAYLSWEAAYNLSHGGDIDYREIPSIVGGDPTTRHGIVLAKSIPAKAYGVQTGESLYMALNKCPDLLIIPAHFSRYIKASDAMVDLISRYTDKIQRYSIDEVFTDMSIYKKDYLKVASEISKNIKEELGFTVNIGISENKLLAKMASDFSKPDKIHTLFKDEIESKMWPLDVGDLFMVGSRTSKKLKGRGIKTIGDLANMDDEYIYTWLKKPGLQILSYARGEEFSDVHIEMDEIKSIGNSTTTPFDVTTMEDAERFILGLSEMVGFRLRRENMCAEVIRISIKNFDFMKKRRQIKLHAPIDSTTRIFEVAMELFKEMWDGDPIRKFSVSVSDLSSNKAVQLSMFEETYEKDKKFDTCVDNIRRKYGSKEVVRSTFLYSKIEPVIGGVAEDAKEYPMMKSLL